MSKTSSSDLSEPVSPTPTGPSFQSASMASNVSSPDLGEILPPTAPRPSAHSVCFLGELLSPVSPGLSAHPTKSIDLVHRLAVRITCHMVRDRRSEARVHCEVEECIRISGAIPSEEHAIEIHSDDNFRKSELQLSVSRRYSWNQALILDWVSSSQEALQNPEGRVPAPPYIMQMRNAGAIAPLPDVSSGNKSVTERPQLWVAVYCVADLSGCPLHPV